MCVSAADKKRAGARAYESLEHGMNQTPPISCRGWPLLQRKMEGGEGKTRKGCLGQGRS